MAQALGVFSWIASSCKLQLVRDGRRASCQSGEGPADGLHYYIAYLCMDPNVTSQDKHVCSQSSNLMHLFQHSGPSDSLVIQRPNISQC